MKRPFYTLAMNGVVTIVAVCAVSFGLWVAVMATRENIHLSHAIAQMLGVVVKAQDRLHESQNDPAQALNHLLQSIMEASPSEVQSNDSGVPQALINPWHRNLVLTLNPINEPPSPTVMPPNFMLTLQNDVPLAACREIVSFFVSEPSRLQLIQHIEVQDEKDMATSRMLYDRKDANGSYDFHRIKNGCGSTPKVVLIVSFLIR